MRCDAVVVVVVAQGEAVYYHPMMRSTVIRHVYMPSSTSGGGPYGRQYHETDVDVDDYAIGIPTFDDRRHGGGERRWGGTRGIGEEGKEDEHFFPSLSRVAMAGTCTVYEFPIRLGLKK